MNDYLQSGFRIGDWDVYPQENLLKNSDCERVLEPKVMDVLVFLAGRQGDVISRQQLLDAVWAGVVVGDETLSRAISLLRSELGDNQKNPRYMKTVSKRGYCLIADVITLAAQDKAPGQAKHKAAISMTTFDKSVAVIPFVNLSQEQSNEPFVNGIHDDLVTQISKIESIKVIARTSVLQYTNTIKTARQIADDLGVATILEGGVQRVGDRVRVNVQLVDGITEEHLWAEGFDSHLTVSNVFDIQTEIATAVAAALQITLSSEEREKLEVLPTQNFSAYQAYLLGKQRMAIRTSSSLDEAISYFQEAIELDPDLTLAYVGLAETYQLQLVYSGLSRKDLYAKGEIAVNKALALNDNSGEAYAVSGFMKADRGDFAGAEADLMRALALNKNNALAYHYYAFLLSRTGRTEESLAQLMKGIEFDPLSPIINYHIAYRLAEMGQFDEALTQYEKVIEIDPDFAAAYVRIGDIQWMARGRLDDALMWYLKSFHRDPANPNTVALISMLYLNLRDDKAAETWLNRLGPLDSLDLIWPRFAMGLHHNFRGDQVQALAYSKEVLRITPDWLTEPAWWTALAHLRDHDLKNGRHAEARARYAELYPALLNEKEPNIKKTNYVPAIDLALVLQRTGELDRANELLVESLKFLQSLPRLGFEGYGVHDVRIHALRGQTEIALTALEEAIQQGWRTNWWFYVGHDSSLDSLRGEPKFQSMVRDIEADMADQLARVQEWDANGELAPIPKLLE